MDRINRKNRIVATVMHHIQHYNCLLYTSRPGLSGLAQVNGRNFVDWDHRLAFDVQYAKKITFIGDIRIILQTVLQFVKKQDIAVDTNKVEPNFAEERRKKCR